MFAAVIFAVGWQSLWVETKCWWLAGAGPACVSMAAYKEPLCELKRGEIINVKLLEPSFAFEFREIQFVLIIDSIPSFPALTRLDIYRRLRGG